MHKPSSLHPRAAQTGHEQKASDLHEHQNKQACTLDESQKKVIEALEGNHNQRIATLLEARAKADTAEETRDETASALTKAHRETTAMLHDSHTKAAKALKDSQTEAASALKASNAKADENLQEKDQVIAWMRGDYSVNNGKPE